MWPTPPFLHPVHIQLPSSSLLYAYLHPRFHSWVSIILKGFHHLNLFFSARDWPQGPMHTRQALSYRVISLGPSLIYLSNHKTHNSLCRDKNTTMMIFYVNSQATIFPVYSPELSMRESMNLESTAEHHSGTQDLKTTSDNRVRAV